MASSDFQSSSRLQPVLAPSTREHVNILSLDGGGIKGYTSLLILQQIFGDMKDSNNNPPKPCDVFDLIVGTSTGGLIAIMLGRLHMSIDECLDKYRKLGKTVFGKKSSGGPAGRAVRIIQDNPLYQIEELQSAMERMLRDTNRRPDELFLEQEAPKCRV